MVGSRQVVAGRGAAPSEGDGARVAAGGFTLLELMIAIALMLVITLQLQIVFNGARTMFMKAEALVEVFQNARNAVDMIERDLANAVLTDQMEFFADNRTIAYGRGHYNLGEQLPELRRGFFDSADYVYSLSVKQPSAFRPPRPAAGGPYRRDSFYFRTFTSVAGKQKEALVEYFLSVGPDPDRPRNLPILQRRVIEVERIDVSGRPIIRKRDPEDVCYYVQEFKVEPFLRDRSYASVGRFYSASEAAQGGSVDLRAPNLLRYSSTDGMGIMCVELGEGELDRDGVLTVTRTSNTPQKKLQNLTPGDRMYLLTRPPAGQTFRTDFNTYLTIKQIDRRTGGQVKLRFDQEAQIKNAMGALTVPTVTATFRAAFLPPAIRITLKIKDARSTELRTIQRVFRVGS